jgi:hypothetical protein
MLSLIAPMVSALLAPFAVLASVSTGNVAAQVTGISGTWMLANISYAGMRAQNNPNSGWRIVAFIFGFPGTLISFLAVKEGSDRAYGIDIPRRKP